MTDSKNFLGAFLISLMMPALGLAQSASCPNTGDEVEADCLYSQAVVAQESKHDLAEGRRLLSQALSIRERLTPPSNTIEESKQYLGLADIYHALGRNGKAEPMYRHSLAILRNTVGPDSLETIIVIDHLALILMDAGRFVEAEPGLRKSVAIIEKEKGPDHQDLIAPLDKLAWICDSTHRGQEASDFRKRIETIKSKSH